MKQDNRSSPDADRARERQQVKAETKPMTRRYEDGDFNHVYPAGDQLRYHVAGNETACLQGVGPRSAVPVLAVY